MAAAQSFYSASNCLAQKEARRALAFRVSPFAVRFVLTLYQASAQRLYAIWRRKSKHLSRQDQQNLPLKWRKRALPSRKACDSFCLLFYTIFIYQHKLEANLEAL